MRVAIVSDIHSNLAALEAVLADADSRRIDEVWCAGDIVGYGPEPSACLRIVRERASVCIAGNHDLGVAGGASPSLTASGVPLQQSWRGMEGSEHAAVNLAWFNEHARIANLWT